MSEVDAIARDAVEAAMLRHPHTRDMCARLATWALIKLAEETSDERAMDVAYERAKHHRERAAKAIRFTGTRR